MYLFTLNHRLAISQYIFIKYGLGKLTLAYSKLQLQIICSVQEVENAVHFKIDLMHCII